MKPTTKMAYRLSKSAFLQFLKCPQEFWLEAHQPLLSAEPVTLEHEHFRQQGYAVESYVKQLGQFQTDDEKFVDFQRTFQTSDLIARCDIVVTDRRSGQVDIYEVKSSSSVKDEYYDDVAFQRLVAERAGFRVRNVYVVTMNSEYVRSGEIDPEQLFVIHDLTEAIELRLPNTADQTWLAFEYLKTFPAAALADYCIDRKLECRFLQLHFSDLPTHTVFDLVYLKHERRRELLRSGVIDVVDIPEGFPLSEKQKIQVQVARAGQPLIDRDGIAKRLASLEYPLHFLDYETFQYAIPQFEGVRPFQQMVFQYSLHTIDEPGAEPRHSEYLSHGGDKPAREVAESLFRELGGEIGSVLVWYESFEKSRNEEFAAMFPEYAEFFNTINERTVDLMKIFSDGLYVDPQFKGRTSIKKVLPVLAPDLDYKQLGIGEGMTATIMWYRAAKWPSLSDAEREKIFNDLYEYCKLDTWAMVRIFRELEKAAGIR